MEQVRLNKFLAAHGICSRREADRFVDEGKVIVNGKKAQQGQRVSENDDIVVDGQLVGSAPKPRYIAFHKPVGLITTTDTSKKDNVITFLDLQGRVFPVGRLDVASSGLLLLTNDGELANKIMHPRYEHEKEYRVRLDKPVTEAFIKKMMNGIRLDGVKVRPAEIEQVGQNSVLLTLTEGKNRQIRRMCEELGYEVKELTRLRVMNINLGEMPVGEYRELSKKEVQELQRRTSVEK